MSSRKSRKLQGQPSSAQSAGAGQDRQDLNVDIPSHVTEGQDPAFAPTSTFQRPATPSSATSQSHQKVAIPRIRKEGPSSIASSATGGAEKHRVGHACEPCRSRKTKCSGETPVCKHCENHKIECYYADGKRDRAKKEIAGMIDKLDECDKLFRQILPQLDRDGQLAVQQLLSKSPSPGHGYSPHAASAADKGKQSLGIDSPDQLEGEKFASARVGSIGSADHVSEDFDRNDKARATGVYSKHSEVAWIQRVEHQLNDGSSTSESTRRNKALADPNELTYTPHNSKADGKRAWSSTVDVAYHLDDLDTTVLQEVDESTTPPRETADALINVYFTTVHPSFPFLLKYTFLAQYQTYYRTFDEKFSRYWLAILNLVFAIGAKHSHMTKAEWRGDERDHLLYLARARSLALNDPTFVNTPPTFELVQVLGLFTFYLTATSQVSRGWIMAGTCLRIAQTLGLHLLNTSTTTSDVQKEAGVRAWWSIFVLERLLCIITGRPSAVADHDVKTSLPIDVEEENFPRNGRNLYTTERPSFNHARSDRALREPSSHESSVSVSPGVGSSASSSVSRTRQSTSTSRSRSHDRASYKGPDRPRTAGISSYFLYRVEIGITTHTILEKLFSPHALDQTWAEAQKIITVFDKELKRWKRSLPALFDFSKDVEDQKFFRQRMALGFTYYSSQILLTRPCVCRLDRRIPNESSKSREFNRETAAACVMAAQKLISLFPDELDCSYLYAFAPWWCVLHQLVQATSVLMLEMSMHADHIGNKSEDLLKHARKALRWLRAMAEDNLSARRAWTIIFPLIRKAARRVGGDLSDLADPQSPQTTRPPSYMQSSQPFSQVSMDPSLNLTSAEQMDTEQIFQLSQAAYPLSATAFNDVFDPNQWGGYDEYNPYYQGEVPVTQQPSQENAMFGFDTEMRGARQEDEGPGQREQQQRQSGEQRRRGSDEQMDMF